MMAFQLIPNSALHATLPTVTGNLKRVRDDEHENKRVRVDLPTKVGCSSAIL